MQCEAFQELLAQLTALRCRSSHPLVLILVVMTVKSITTAGDRCCLYKFIYAYFMLTASTAYNMQSCKAASNKVIAKSICDKQLTIK